jgi:hypothetical protein
MRRRFRGLSRPAVNAVRFFMFRVCRGRYFPDLRMETGRSISRAKRILRVEGVTAKKCLPVAGFRTAVAVVVDEGLSCISDNGRFRHRRQRT